MNVLPLTVYLSLLLALVFLAAFVRMALKPSASCAEQESLLPLEPDGQAPAQANPNQAPTARA